MHYYIIFVYAEIHHQYDTMVFPEDLRVSAGFTDTVVTGFNKVMSFLGFKSKDSAEAKQELKVPTNTDMRYQCFLLYLEKYKNILLSEFSKEMTINQFVDDVHKIFTSLLKIDVTYQKESSMDKRSMSSIEKEKRPMKKV